MEKKLLWKSSPTIKNHPVINLRGDFLLYLSHAGPKSRQVVHLAIMEQGEIFLQIHSGFLHRLENNPASGPVSIRGY
jgi:hypothetical protein